MAHYTPPLHELNIFNQDDFSHVDTGYLLKSGDISSGLQIFNAGIDTNSVLSDTNLTISAPTIYIGQTGDNILIQGNSETINTTNLNVKDNLITINKGGSNATAQGSGIEVEGTNGSVKASLKLNSNLDFELFSANSKLSLDAIGERTTGYGVHIKNNLDLENHSIGNCNTISGQTNTDINVSALGTGKIVLNTGNAPKWTVDNTGKLSAIVGSKLDMGSNDIANVGAVVGNGTNSLFIGHSTPGIGGIDLYTNGTRRIGINSAGQVYIPTTTDATTTTDGALQTDGGLSVAKSAYIGGQITTTGLTARAAISSLDSTCNGVPTGSTGAYHHIIYGGRKTYLSQDATDTSINYIGTDGGSGNDPDFEVAIKRGTGMLIYNQTTAEIDAWATGNERLRVSGNAKVTGNLSCDSITISTSSTTGALKVNGGIATQSQINTVYGIGLGTDDNATSGGCITNTDNYNNSVFGTVNFGISGAYLPRGLIPRMMRFMMAKPLTVGTATTVLTLTHTANATEEDSFAICFRGIIHASTTSNTSSRNQNFIIGGCRANGSAFTMNSSSPVTSILTSTNATNLNLGTLAFSYPTNTATTTSIAISQPMTAGTPSQALFITGEWELYQTTSTGGLFLTGIS